MNTKLIRRDTTGQLLRRALQAARDSGSLDWHFVAGFIAASEPTLAGQIRTFEADRYAAILAKHSPTATSEGA